jgi:DNA-binding PadR family transcriptional regulator
VDAERSLSVGEWSVLGLLCEAPAHGWALAETLAPEGEVGAVWSLSRPLVYRALEMLEQRGLVERVGLASSTRGPSRTVSRPTKRGRTAFARWLREPVEHIRDLRPTLLLKLVFLHRAGRDPRKLLDTQQSVIEGRLSELDQQLADASAEAGILVRYRIEVARAALRFVDAEQRESQLVGSP